jgi:hypothetical protein
MDFDNYNRQTSWDDMLEPPGAVLSRTLAARDFDSLTLPVHNGSIGHGSDFNNPVDAAVPLYGISSNSIRGSLFGANSSPRLSVTHNVVNNVNGISPRISIAGGNYASPRISLLYNGNAGPAVTDEFVLRMSGDLAVPDVNVSMDMNLNMEPTQRISINDQENDQPMTFHENISPPAAAKAPRFAIHEAPASPAPVRRFDDNTYQDPEDEMEENMARMEQQLLEIKQLREMMEKTQAKFLREQEILMCRMSVANFLNQIKPNSPNPPSPGGQ